MAITKLSVVRTLRIGEPIPDKHTIARCLACDRGVTWPAGTARLNEMRCPRCGGPVRQTTRALRRPFLVLSREAARAQARRARELAKAETAARIAAGETKLARDLAAGDVIYRRADRRDDPMRVVQVGLPGDAHSHVGIRAQLSLEAIRRSGLSDRLDDLAARRLSFPARREVWLGHPQGAGHTWARLPGQVRVAAAERDLDQAERMLAGAARRNASGASEHEDEHERTMAAAWTARRDRCRAELAQAHAQLAREQQQ